jgi:hypothetical protein
MKSLSLAVALLVCAAAFAQNEFASEEFELSFVKKDKGAGFLFNGKSHSFTVDIISDSIQTTENPNFIVVNNRVVQASTVPLPTSKLDLSNLSVATQKETLNAYVDYELEYFKSDLKMKYTNLKREWITIGSKVWLIWSFSFSAANTGKDLATQYSYQLYASTICFNQVLDLNSPSEKTSEIDQSKALVNQLMNSLKMFDKRQ